MFAHNFENNICQSSETVLFAGSQRPDNSIIY